MRIAGGGFQAYGHAPSVYHESALFGAPHLPFRPPELASARYQSNNPHAFNYTATTRMSDPTFMAADDEFAQMQKLSNEYEPETTASMRPTRPGRALTFAGPARRRAPEHHCHRE